MSGRAARRSKQKKLRYKIHRRELAVQEVTKIVRKIIAQHKANQVLAVLGPKTDLVS